MKILYGGIDISPEVSVNACCHDMYFSGESDSLLLRFNNTRNLWDAWNPRIGDMLAVEEDGRLSGAMHITAAAPRNGMFTIYALSCPASLYVEQHKAWENVRLMHILGEIADRHGLALEVYGVEDLLYRYVKQDGQSDAAFLQDRLEREGCGFLVYDNKLIVHSREYIKSQPPAGTIVITHDSDYDYDEPAAIWTPTLTKLAPGSVVSLVDDLNPHWSGPVLLTHIRNDYAKGRSKLFFEKV